MGSTQPDDSRIRLWGDHVPRAADFAHARRAVMPALGPASRIPVRFP
jgi:hypothetical protein